MITTRDTNNGNLKKTIYRNTANGMTAIVGHFPERSDRTAYELVEILKADKIGALHRQSLVRFNNADEAQAYVTRKLN